jgi:hypothetical protein
MSLEILFFQVLCILGVIMFCLCVFECTRNKKPTQRSSAEQATRISQTAK